jgi:predicted DNA binding protein
MKKLLSLLLIAILLTACTETSNETLPAQTTEVITQQIVAITTQHTSVITEPIQQEPQTAQEINQSPPNYVGRYFDDSVPVLPDHRYDGFFVYKYTENFEFNNSVGEIGGIYEEYLGHTDWRTWMSDIDDFRKIVYMTSLMDYPNLFSIIVKYNIPDEIVIRAIEENNTYYKDVIGGDMYDMLYLSTEDISALLTRCEATVLQHFASPAAIVVGDRIYNPAWIYSNTVEGYRAAGITQEMLVEKLPFWIQVGSIGDSTAFEGKLTEFVGVEVSLARE